MACMSSLSRIQRSARKQSEKSMEGRGSKTEVVPGAGTNPAAPPQTKETQVHKNRRMRFLHVRSTPGGRRPWKADVNPCRPAAPPLAKRLAFITLV